MPNVCFSTIEYKGELNILKKISESLPKLPATGNEVLDKLNIPADRYIPVGKVMESSISTNSEGESTLSIDVESAWSPQLTIWKEIPKILEVENEVTLEFEGNEESEELYVKSKGFDIGNYQINYYIGEGENDDGLIDCDNVSDIARELKKLFKDKPDIIANLGEIRENSVLKTLKEWIDEYMEQYGWYAEIDSDYYLKLLEYDIVEVDDFVV